MRVTGQGPNFPSQHSVRAMKSEPLTRAKFIAKFMHTLGCSYVEACNIYDCMVEQFKEAVVDGSKIYIGRVGALDPVWQEPKVVHMGFKRVVGSVVREDREFVLGRRIRYRFRLFKRFIQQHQLNWF